MQNLIKLRDYLNENNNKEIDLSIFGLTHTVGLDEIPNDRKFFKKLFKLRDKDFDFLFVPKDIKINTVGEYVALLSTYIHLNGK